MSQITHFCDVKLLAWKSGCVKFLTNSMSESKQLIAAIGLSMKKNWHGSQIFVTLYQLTTVQCPLCCSQCYLPPGISVPARILSSHCRMVSCWWLVMRCCPAPSRYWTLGPCYLYNWPSSHCTFPFILASYPWSSHSFLNIESTL